MLLMTRGSRGGARKNFKFSTHESELVEIQGMGIRGGLDECRKCLFGRSFCDKSIGGNLFRELWK